MCGPRTRTRTIIGTFETFSLAIFFFPFAMQLVDCLIFSAPVSSTNRKYLNRWLLRRNEIPSKIMLQKQPNEHLEYTDLNSHAGNSRFFCAFRSAENRIKDDTTCCKPLAYRPIQIVLALLPAIECEKGNRMFRGFDTTQRQIHRLRSLLDERNQGQRLHGGLYCFLFEQGKLQNCSVSIYKHCTWTVANGTWRRECVSALSIFSSFFARVLTANEKKITPSRKNQDAVFAWPWVVFIWQRSSFVKKNFLVFIENDAKRRMRRFSLYK